MGREHATGIPCNQGKVTTEQETSLQVPRLDGGRVLRRNRARRYAPPVLPEGKGFRGAHLWSQDRPHHSGAALKRRSWRMGGERNGGSVRIGARLAHPYKLRENSFRPIDELLYMWKASLNGDHNRRGCHPRSQHSIPEGSEHGRRGGGGPTERPSLPQSGVCGQVSGREQKLRIGNNRWAFVRCMYPWTKGGGCEGA